MWDEGSDNCKKQRLLNFWNLRETSEKVPEGRDEIFLSHPTSPLLPTRINKREFKKKSNIKSELNF